MDDAMTAEDVREFTEEMNSMAQQTSSWDDKCDRISSDSDRETVFRHLEALDRNLHLAFANLTAKHGVFQQMAEKMNTLDEKIRALGAATNKIENLKIEEKTKTLNNHINDLQSEVQKLSPIRAGLNTTDESIKLLVRQAKIFAATTQDNLDKLTIKINDIPKIDLGDVTKKVGDFTTKIENLKIEEKIAPLDQHIKDLKAEIAKLEPIRTDLVATNTSMEKVASTTQDNLDQLTIKIDDIPKIELDKLVKKEDLDKLTTDKIDKLVKKEDLDKLTTDKIDNLAKTTDLSKLTDELTKLDKQVADFAKEDRKFDQSITDEITKISQGVNITPKEMEVKLVRGNEITGGKYEAEIELEGKKVDTFSPVGYYFYNGNIYIYNHLKPNNEITIPCEFHYLKVIKTKEEGYKLAFCTEYGHEYHKIPGDHRFIGIKSIENIDLASHNNGSKPSFIARAGHNGYPGSEQHGVDIYEINSTKAKVGSLINEFGYYDVQNKFHYTNYQMGTQSHPYDPPSFTITRGDNQCQSHKMKVNGTDHNLSNNTMDCSLVEYIANDVNSII